MSADLTTPASRSSTSITSVDWTEWAADPYPLYRMLRDESPVPWDEPNETYVLTHYDDGRVRAVAEHGAGQIGHILSLRNVLRRRG